jgi:hypothetical protein
MNAWMTAMVLAGSVTMVGCATMVNKRHQNVLVVSEPPGADVLLNGDAVGTTPVTVRMKRRGPVELQLRKAGCATETVPVSRRLSGWVAGNLFWLNPLAGQGMDSLGQWLRSAIGGFVSVITIDALSGGAYVRPRVVEVTLAPASDTAGCG